MSEEIFILEGDFIINEEAFYDEGYFHVLGIEKICGDNLISLKVATQELIDTHGWKIQLDSIELDDNQVLFLAAFKDGRKFLGFTDPRTLELIRENLDH